MQEQNIITLSYKLKLIVVTFYGCYKLYHLHNNNDFVLEFKTNHCCIENFNFLVKSCRDSMTGRNAGGVVQKERMRQIHMDDRELITSEQNLQYQTRSFKGETSPGGNTRQKTIIYVVLTLLAWSGLFYGGYYFTSKYLQQTHPLVASQMEEIKLENQRVEAEINKSMQLLREDINESNQEIMQVRSELNIIREKLELTGETLTGTDETRQSLQEQMTELDQQLALFKEQLEKLEEAVRAF